MMMQNRLRVLAKAIREGTVIPMEKRVRRRDGKFRVAKT